MKKVRNGQPFNQEDLVPNYKKLNIKPREMQPGNPHFLVSQGSKHNPRERVAPQVRAVPFAEVVVDDKFPIGGGPVPNIGNNIEHTWAGVDGEIIDDLSLDDDQFIDNNENVDIAPLTPSQRKIQALFENQYREDKNAANQIDTVDSKNLEEYSLLIFGEFYSTGSLEEIQKEVTEILYESHPLCDHNKITLDDLTVLKKMSIKFGVFVSEE